MSKKAKLNELSLNKKTITRLNDSQMSKIKGGAEAAAPSWSCSNLLCGAVSVGKFCDVWY